ncbi:YqaJ viral recombinase family protein [Agromyces sp. MMS24-K17]|uniref:YqaJ viral recombinase family protein n=1 Tax=Agromyces sp. MMS24-K17 TaxID=3372850 RepID=UPI00375452F0
MREPLPHERRVVADSGDRVAWLRARARGVTATDAAKLASKASVRTAAWEKVHGSGGRGFGGSRFTDHGREREPVIAQWVREQHGIDHSSLLFHAEGERAHLATPDGLRVTESGTVELCEIKTTSKPWRGIPRGYLRQVWWQQYVLGAERTLVVWEEHDGFVPVGEQPLCRWVDRDEDQIAILIGYANELLAAIAPTAPPVARPDAVRGSDRSFYRPGPLA